MPASGVGEAVFGLTAVADTTSPVYWVLIGAASHALLVAMLVRRIRGGRWTLLAVLVALEQLATLSLLARWVDECDLIEAP